MNEYPYELNGFLATHLAHTKLIGLRGRAGLISKPGLDTAALDREYRLRTIPRVSRNLINYFLNYSSYSFIPLIVPVIPQRKVRTHVQIVGNPNRYSEFLARKLRNDCKRIVYATRTWRFRTHLLHTYILSSTYILYRLGSRL